MKLSRGNLVDDLEWWRDRYIGEISALDYSKNTITLYTSKIYEFIEYMREFDDEISISEIKRANITNFLSYIDELRQKQGIKLSKTTKTKYLQVLKNYFLFITENNDEQIDYTKIFKDIKLKGIEKSKEKLNYFSQEEVKAILEVINHNVAHNRTYYNISMSLLIKLQLFGGLRISEALNLKLSDISDDGGKFYCVFIVGKGGYEQEIYIKKEAIAYEMNYINSVLESDEWLFQSANGKQQNRINAYRNLQNIYKKAGINKKGCHILRHSLAMELLNQNVNLGVIQKTLRHKRIETTTIYANANSSMIKAGLDKVGF